MVEEEICSGNIDNSDLGILGGGSIDYEYLGGRATPWQKKPMERSMELQRVEMITNPTKPVDSTDTTIPAKQSTWTSAKPSSSKPSSKPSSLQPLPDIPTSPRPSPLPTVPEEKIYHVKVPIDYSGSKSNLENTILRSYIQEKHGMNVDVSKFMNDYKVDFIRDRNGIIDHEVRRRHGSMPSKDDLNKKYSLGPDTLSRRPITRAKPGSLYLTYQSYINHWANHHTDTASKDKERSLYKEINDNFLSISFVDEIIDICKWRGKFLTDTIKIIAKEKSMKLDEIPLSRLTKISPMVNTLISYWKNDLRAHVFGLTRIDLLEKIINSYLYSLTWLLSQKLDNISNIKRDIEIALMDKGNSILNVFPFYQVNKYPLFIMDNIKTYDLVASVPSSSVLESRLVDKVKLYPYSEIKLGGDAVVGPKILIKKMISTDDRFPLYNLVNIISLPDDINLFTTFFNVALMIVIIMICIKLFIQINNYRTEGMTPYTNYTNDHCMNEYPYLHGTYFSPDQAMGRHVGRVNLPVDRHVPVVY